jgi:LytS/YehU family sensor histidine kinase
MFESITETTHLILYISNYFKEELERQQKEQIKYTH